MGRICYAKARAVNSIDAFERRAARDEYVREHRYMVAVPSCEAKTLAKRNGSIRCHGECRPPKSWDGKNARWVCDTAPNDFWSVMHTQRVWRYENV